MKFSNLPVRSEVGREEVGVLIVLGEVLATVVPEVVLSVAASVVAVSVNI